MYTGPILSDWSHLLTSLASTFLLVHGVTAWLLLRAEGLSPHLRVLAKIWAAGDEQGSPWAATLRLQLGPGLMTSQRSTFT